MILPLFKAVGLPCDSPPIRTLVDLEDWEIKNFILLNAFYTDNVDYIYYDYIIHTDQSINSYHYPLNNIQRMAYEVFGIFNWDGLRNSNIDWNENDQAYETGLEFEIGRITETKKSLPRTTQRRIK